VAGSIDTSGWLKKRDALRKNVSEAAEFGLIDAGEWFHGMLAQTIINGGHPRVRPYVGVVTGNLKRSVKNRPLSTGKVRVYIDVAGGQVPYAPDVLRWSKIKYGRSFMEIAVEKFSKPIVRIMTKELARAVEAASNGQSYEYKNNFPKIPVT